MLMNVERCWLCLNSYFVPTESEHDERKETGVKRSLSGCTSGKQPGAKVVFFLNELFVHVSVYKYKTPWHVPNN